VTGWLLDTNILSELRRPRPERKVVAFVAAQPLERLHVSSATFAEIRFGIERAADAGRRAAPQRLARTQGAADVRAACAGDHRGYHVQVAAACRRRPQDRSHFSQPDLIIAATALHHGLTVVSRDVSDYQKAHVSVLNPWIDPQ